MPESQKSNSGQQQKPNGIQGRSINGQVSGLGYERNSVSINGGSQGQQVPVFDHLVYKPNGINNTQQTAHPRTLQSIAKV
jgi:hypothetical protein